MWLTPRPGRFTPEKETRYPFYMRLGGPQGRSGRVRRKENLAATGIRASDRLAHIESLRLSQPVGPDPSVARCDWFSEILICMNILQRVLSSALHLYICCAAVCMEARSQNCQKRLLTSTCLSVCLSVCPFARDNFAPTRRLFIKSYISGFFENLSTKFKFF